MRRRASSASSAAPKTNTISRSCPSASSIWVWSAAQGSRPAPVLPDNRTRRSAAGSASEPLRPMNSVRFPVTVRLGSLTCAKTTRPGLVRRVGVAGEQRAAVGILFGDDVHQIGVPPLAQHQLPIPGERQPPGAPRMVAQLDRHELHRRVHGDVGGQLREDAGFVVLEHAVAEPVPAHIPGPAGGGQRRGRPERARLLVAEVERLAAAVADRVVVEGGQAELVGVLHPGVGAAPLADDRADVRAGDDVGPRRRRALAGLEGDDVFAAVRREAAQAVVEDAFARRQGLDLLGCRWHAMAPAAPAGARPARGAAPARPGSRRCR